MMFWNDEGTTMLREKKLGFTFVLTQGYNGSFYKLGLQEVITL